MNTQYCYINILLNTKRIWNVSSNHKDSKIVNIINNELKTCSGDYTKSILPIFKRYGFSMKSRRVAPFSEYLSSPDLNNNTVKREIVYDLVFYRNC